MSRLEIERGGKSRTRALESMWRQARGPSTKSEPLHRGLDLATLFAAYWVVPEPAPQTAVILEMKEPKHYTSAAVLAVHAYGLLLVVPVVAAIALLSLYIAEWSLAVPFIAMAVTAFILPFGLGNPHVCRLVRSFCPQATRGEGFVVQVTYQPRKRSGVRGLLEDADDVGWLSFTDKAAVFEGDASRFVIPYEKIKEIHRQNVGLRGLYLYGRRLELKIQGMPGAESVLIAERSSWILPGSRRNMRSLWQQAAARVASSREANPARG